MIIFLKNSSLETIKIKLLLLYTLNVTDIIFTLFLINTGYFVEANIIMAKLIENPSISIIVKTILPAILLIGILIRMQKATKQQLRISNCLINMITSLYALINLSHIICITLLLYV